MRSHLPKLALLALSAAMLPPLVPRPAGARAMPPAEEAARASPPEPGLYLVSAEGDAPGGLVRLRQRMPDDYHQSGTIGMTLTRGLAPARMHVVLAGARAEVRTPAARPEFCFRFGENAGKAPASDDMTAVMAAMQGFFGDAPPWNATRPEDFQLVRLSVEGETRKAETGSVGGLKGASGKSRDAVGFDVEKAGPHEFRVRTKQPLTPGEYGFYFSGQGPGARIWDFGVDPP